MKNKKWKQFSKLTEKCYNNMIGAEKDGSCWVQAFELLMEIVREERQTNPNYASELEMLEEVTDWADVLIIANKDSKFSQIVTKPEQIIVDLVRVKELEKYNNYNGLWW